MPRPIASRAQVGRAPRSRASRTTRDDKPDQQQDCEPFPRRRHTGKSVPLEQRRSSRRHRHRFAGDLSKSYSSVPAISRGRQCKRQQSPVLANRRRFEGRRELRRIGVVRIDDPADLVRQEADEQRRRGMPRPVPIPTRDRPPRNQASSAAGTSPASVNRNIVSR